MGKSFCAIENQLTSCRKRFAQYIKALTELMGLLFVIFGSCTVLLWFLVVDHPSIILFFTYTTSYTAVLLCQVRGNAVTKRVISTDEGPVSSLFHEKPSPSCHYSTMLLFCGIYRWLRSEGSPGHCDILLRFRDCTKRSNDQRRDWHRHSHNTIVQQDEQSEGFESSHCHKTRATAL